MYFFIYKKIDIPNIPFGKLHHIGLDQNFLLGNVSIFLFECYKDHKKSKRFLENLEIDDLNT